jgi:hypothetical protein
VGKILLRGTVNIAVEGGGGGGGLQMRQSKPQLKWLAMHGSSANYSELRLHSVLVYRPPASSVGRYQAVNTINNMHYLIHHFLGVVLYTLQRQFRLYIPFLGIARPQPQFPHSCVFIYIFPGSVYIFPPAEQADPSWEYIIRSQTHECGNWD